MIKPSSNGFANSQNQGGAGYDNPRENIDPHIKTKVLNTVEGTIQKVPVNSNDIVNKSYADSIIPATPLFSQTQPSRALNTTYQNSTGKNLIVYGDIRCLFSDQNGAVDVASFECKSDASNPPTTVRHQGGTPVATSIVVNNSFFDQAFPFFFVVKAGHYYRIDSTVGGIGSATLNHWNEVESLNGV